MKFAVIADIHANSAALDTFFEFEEEYRHLLYLGDMLGYGPEPIKTYATLLHKVETECQGDLDDAFESGDYSSVAEPYRDLAIETMELHKPLFSGEPRLYFKSIPKRAIYEADGFSYTLVHGGPSDWVRGIVSPEASDEELEELMEEVDTDVLIVAHGHVPFLRQVGDKRILNPGSIGQPRDGNPEISFAVVEDGDIEIIRRPYDIEATVSALTEMDLRPESVEKLVHVLRTGTDPV